MKNRAYWVEKFVLSLYVLMVPIILSAQEPRESKTRYYRHEVNVGRCAVSLRKSQWYRYESLIESDFNVERYNHGFMDSSDTPSGFQLDYYYHFNEWLSVGLVSAFMGSSKPYDKNEVEIHSFYGYYDYEDNWKEREIVEKKIAGLKNSRIKNNSFFLMPSVKACWLNNHWCSLYSKGSLGIHYQRLRFISDDFPKERTEPYNHNKCWLVYVVTPIGLEIGKQNCRFFMELGFGSNTSIQIGLTYRFSRFLNDN